MCVCVCGGNSADPPAVRQEEMLEGSLVAQSLEIYI